MADHKDGAELSLRTRKIVKQAQCMSLSAVLLGTASVVLLAVTIFQSRAEPGGQVAATQAIGLSAAPEPSEDGEIKGWYRTRLRSMVRTSAEMDSAPVSILPVGTYVWVTEGQGRRVKVVHPVEGWCSTRTADGLEILRKDRSKEDLSDVDALLMKDKKFLATQQRLQDVQKKLAEAKKKLEASIANLQSNKVGKVVIGDTEQLIALAPSLKQKAFEGATDALHRVVKPEEAKDFLGNLLDQPKLKVFMRDAEAEATSATEGVVTKFAQTPLAGRLSSQVEAGARVQGEEFARAAGQAMK